jgi:hypothetical protein
VTLVTLSLNDVVDFKNEVNSNFGCTVHFHDGCGGQYFTLDEYNDDLKEFIVSYFSNKNINVNFSDDGLHFTLL